MWQDWLNFILGIWLVIAAFIPGITGSQGAALVDYLIVGILVLVFAIWVARKKAAEWANVIFGIWLIIAAFIPAITGNKTANLWNSLILGILILIFALLAALKKESS